MNLSMARHIYDSILNASRQAAPAEACGLLGGENGCATQFFELYNADESNEHYRMLPEEQFAAVREMRSQGLQLLAIWHSHPETPPRMPAEDLRLAYTPNVAYIILSLANPIVPEMRGFVVEDGAPEEVAVEIVSRYNEDATFQQTPSS